MKSTFEKMGGTYTLGADGIYYPNLVSMRPKLPPPLKLRLRLRKPLRKPRLTPSELSHSAKQTRKAD